MIRFRRGKCRARDTSGGVAGARVVRAFNQLNFKVFLSEAHRPAPRVAVPLAGDDAEALAVASRLAGVIFFVLFQSSEYHMLGYFDLVFFVPELILLLRMSPAASVTPISARAGVAS